MEPTPLTIASFVEAVKLLLEHRADPSQATQNGATPLIIASFNGHVEAVKLLLEHRADPSQARKDGATPLLADARGMWR
jgi:ankyrin repeat protein